MSTTRTVHVRVEGRVQGVGYRAWVECTAEELRLAGWVRNRRDGSVEMVLQGTAGEVAKMLELCEQGPLHAQVKKIETIGEVTGAFIGFEVRATA